MDDLEALTLDYRAAFLRYLPNRSEEARTSGYQLGRRALDRSGQRLAEGHTVRLRGGIDFWPPNGSVRLVVRDRAVAADSPPLSDSTMSIAAASRSSAA